MHSTAFSANFSCLGADCEDTCCQHWNMQIDDATRTTYAGATPKLLDAIEETELGWIMRKDKATGFCVKYENGLCDIHKEHGDALLGDACHFYPRVTRAIGEHVVLRTATLSCPEIVRLALYQDDGFTLQSTLETRLPYTIKDYAQDGIQPDQMIDLHQIFIQLALDNNTPEHTMARVISLALSLDCLPVASWVDALPFYIENVDSRLPLPEYAENDPINLLHALAGICMAAKAADRPRLRQTIAQMEAALRVQLDWEQMCIYPSCETVAAMAEMEQQWHIYAQHLETTLRRWIAAELSVAFFPFGGFGRNVEERGLLMGVRFATVRLALISACYLSGGIIAQDEQVCIIQSIARLLDHLADPKLSLAIYAEPGWLRESRLRALIGDHAPIFASTDR